MQPNVKTTDSIPPRMSKQTFFFAIMCAINAIDE